MRSCSLSVANEKKKKKKKKKKKLILIKKQFITKLALNANI